MRRPSEGCRLENGRKMMRVKNPARGVPGPGRGDIKTLRLQGNKGIAISLNELGYNGTHKK